MASLTLDLRTENLQLWKDAGLLLNDDGFVIPSTETQSGLPEGNDMKEDMISNALVWLSSRLCNFVGRGEGSNPVPAGDRSQNPQGDDPGDFGQSQKSLLKKWSRLTREFDVWYDGLPATFHPSAQIKVQTSAECENDNQSTFSEIWYSLSMVGAAMAHYHMARILLLMNKPHESTFRHTTVARRYNSYRSIGSGAPYHAYEICGIALSRPEASVRVHLTQPLFIAGQILDLRGEQEVIIHLLQGIEVDLGWDTKERVQQLVKEWGWQTDSQLVKM